MGQDRFSFRYIDAVRMHILSGQIESNADAARLLNVSEQTIRDWRKQYPHFEREFRVAMADALAGVTSQAFSLARQGDGPMRKFLLERRGGPAWQARQHIDHTSNGNSLANILAEHGAMSDEEAYERGLIIDNEDTGDDETSSEIPYYTDVEYFDPEEDEDRDEFDENGEPIR